MKSRIYNKSSKKFSLLILRLYIDNDSIYWIEHYVERTQKVSGKWAIKAYNLHTEMIQTIDQGAFDDFQKYAYEDISFADSMMLFPVNMDISQDTLVYNRVIEEENLLNTQIAAYNVKTKTLEIIAQGTDHVNDYVFDAAVSGNNIVYNKYHEKNSDQLLRPTTYKYCDMYVYNLENQETRQISKNDFFINLEIDNERIAAVRIPEKEEGQGIFARMQITVFDMNRKTGDIVLHCESPIYNEKNDLNIGNPEFMKDFLIWQDYALPDNMYIYNCRTNEFVKIPAKGNPNRTGIIGVTEKSLTVLEMHDDEESKMYKIHFE